MFLAQSPIDCVRVLALALALALKTPSRRTRLRTALIASAFTASVFSVAGCADNGDVVIEGEVDGHSFDGGAGLAELTQDGDLVGIVLNDKPGACNEAPEGEYLSLTIYAAELSPGTYPVGGDAPVVHPYLQVSGKMIETQIESGFLTIETATRDHYVGAFEFIWPGAQPLTGSFDVPTCIRP